MSEPAADSLHRCLLLVTFRVTEDVLSFYNEQMHIRDLIAEYESEALFLHESAFDIAIIGIVERFDGNAGQVVNVVYDKDLLMKVLHAQMEGTDDEKYEAAQEYFDFNIAGAYVGPNGPVFLTTREKLEGKEEL